MDRFEDLRTFVAVVESGSFSRAAERMKVVKSAVSRRVSDLETRLGARLLNRTTRRLSLTETGRAFCERGKRILADMDEAENAVSSQHAALSGTLRVAAPLSFGIAHLAPAFNEFLALHASLDLDLDFNDRQVNVIEEGFDLAIRIGRLADSSLVARRLAPIHHLVCASPAYLARYGVPRVPEDLTRHVGLRYANVPERRVWRFRAATGEPYSVRVPCRLVTNNGDVLRDAAIAGLGLVVSPTFIVDEAVRAGRLVPLLVDQIWSETAAYALYPPGRQLSARVRALVDFLARRFGDHPYWDQCLETGSVQAPARD